jgi:anthranilate synthase component 1/salicylate synthetase
MTSLHAAGYQATRTSFSGDELDVLARLARAGLHDKSVVYESHDEWCFASGAVADLTVDRRGVHLSQRADLGPSRTMPWDGRPLRQVQRMLDELGLEEWRAYGWVAFELAYAEDGDLGPVGDQPLARLLVPHTEVRLEDGIAEVRSFDAATMGLVRALIAAEPVPPGGCTPVDVREHRAEQYLRGVELAIQEIHEHRLEKVILSRRVELAEEVDLVSTYVAGRRANTPARSFLLRLGGLEATGFSPEIVLSVDEDRRVTSQPLAGTRALTGDEGRNAALRTELLSDPKEIYEHAISVKTAWEELRPVCQPGSVVVDELMTVRPRGSVQHLASRVVGVLAPGASVWDAFGAVFPAVTASGVPKPAAYASIRAHEPAARGLYGGAVLTVDSTGAMDAALVLRAVYRQAGRTWLQAGAGIVGQSSPRRELEETCEKLDSVARHIVHVPPDQSTRRQDVTAAAAVSRGGGGHA